MTQQDKDRLLYELSRPWGEGGYQENLEVLAEVLREVIEALPVT